MQAVSYTHLDVYKRQPKDKVRAALEKIGRNENDRAERFSMDEFAALSALI